MSRSMCEEGASGMVSRGNWTALLALIVMLALVFLAQLLLHYTCPHYETPPRLAHRRRRRKAERKAEEELDPKMKRGISSSPALMGGRTAGGELSRSSAEAAHEAGRSHLGRASNRGLLAQASSNRSYQAI